jgi:hypothetical protein
LTYYDWSFLRVKLKSWLISVFICIINVLLRNIIYYLTGKEKFYTYTERLIRCLRVLIIAFFLNYAVTVFIIHYFYVETMWTKNGLIFTVFSIFVVNAVAIPIFTVLDIMHLAS